MHSSAREAHWSASGKALAGRKFGRRGGLVGTLATGVAVAMATLPPTAHLARAAVAEADGRFLAVDDAAILRAYCFLAQQEGIFCEPASAASLAGFWVARASGLIAEGQRVVCVLTGNGLKDPERAVAVSGTPLEAEATAEALVRTLPAELQA